jgi:hypothetical protein
MRRAVALVAFILSLALVPSAPAKPQLPCDYWVHGCNVLEYVCDTGVCADVSLPPAPASKP